MTDLLIDDKGRLINEFQRIRYEVSKLMHHFAIIITNYLEYKKYHSICETCSSFEHSAHVTVHIFFFINYFHIYTCTYLFIYLQDVKLKCKFI